MYTTSLSNWLEFTGSICQKETSFLEEPDLCAIAKAGDHGLNTMEQVVERFFAWFLTCLGRVGCHFRMISHMLLRHQLICLN